MFLLGLFYYSIIFVGRSRVNLNTLGVVTLEGFFGCFFSDFVVVSGDWFGVDLK